MKREFINKDSIKKVKKEVEEGVESIIGEKELSEWKKFAFKGRMVEMAVAFMLGGAFQKVVTSISESLIMPAINFLIGKTGQDWRNYDFTPVDGMTFEIGKFAGSFMDFILISIILYILFRKIFSPILKEDSKIVIKCIELIRCPVCQDSISYKAKRCPSCTSWIDEENKERN
jgi:large conductance mechanosensitive channel